MRDDPYVGAHRQPEEQESTAPHAALEEDPEPAPGGESEDHQQPEEPEQIGPQAPLEEEPEPEPQGEIRAQEGPSEPSPAGGRSPGVVPGQYDYLKRWTFVLVTAAVWIPAALIGLGLYYYWLHSIHKTVPVLMVLMYLVVCALAGLLMAMVEHRPVVAAVSIAVMSAPFASTAAAAALYGAYVFHWLKL